MSEDFELVEFLTNSVVTANYSVAFSPNSLSSKVKVLKMVEIKKYRLYKSYTIIIGIAKKKI